MKTNQSIELSSLFVTWILVILTLVDFSVSSSDTSNNITRIAFGGIRDALPAAYGDFNSDELTDIFILTGEQQTVQILYGSTDSDQLVSFFLLTHIIPKPKCFFSG